MCHQFLTANDLVLDSSYSLRTVNEYVIPFSRTNMRAKCMNVRGPKQWSSLTDVVRNAESLSKFKSNFRSFIFSKY